LLLAEQTLILPRLPAIAPPPSTQDQPEGGEPTPDDSGSDDSGDDSDDDSDSDHSGSSDDSPDN
ncbi:MAG TPA: hypothetical protein VER79_10075, partial [Candidatus Limnocylindrales bacterium]|nr:hypothetical protein [Candidatus Limnocylindrales bacterium]